MNEILESIEANPDPENVMKLVRAALASPTIFGFGELYDCSHVQALQESGDDADLKVFSALELFCFNNYKDYVENSDAYPELSEAEEQKLRQLTLVYLASTSKTLAYDLVQRETGLDAQQVESLVLHCIYSGILEAKISQASLQIQVDWCIGRDVRADGIGHIAHVLSQWKARTTQMIKSIHGQVDKARTRKDINDSEYLAYKDALEEKLEAARAKMLEEGGGGPGGRSGSLGGRRNKRGRAKIGGKRGYDDDRGFF